MSLEFIQLIHLLREIQTITLLSFMQSLKDELYINYKYNIES